MGDGVNLSPLVVSLPLTMIVKEVVLDAYDDTRDLAQLMSAATPSGDAAG